MNRFDRLFGILLALRLSPAVAASNLARRFEVSTRTIYRDLDTLSAAGVPLYAERGRGGGIRLIKGYYLPPLMFSRDEATALIVGMTLLRCLRAPPFVAELDTATNKLLAALPDKLRAALSNTERIIGAERPPFDLFHAEPAAAPATSAADECATISVFLRAILDGAAVTLRYHSPYRAQSSAITATPLGLFWDRDQWYLAGCSANDTMAVRLWRADRVLAISTQPRGASPPSDFDVRTLLDHHWLRGAMDRWRARAPVTIRMTFAQATRLQQDWYYRHAQFEPITENDVLMTFGEDNETSVRDLVRWLGPGAALLAPVAWRERIVAELRQMLAAYD